jgi:hypothetical protein
MKRLPLGMQRLPEIQKLPRMQQLPEMRQLSKMQQLPEIQKLPVMQKLPGVQYTVQLPAAIQLPPDPYTMPETVPVPLKKHSAIVPHASSAANTCAQRPGHYYTANRSDSFESVILDNSTGRETVCLQCTLRAVWHQCL